MRATGAVRHGEFLRLALGLGLGVGLGPGGSGCLSGQEQRDFIDPVERFRLQLLRSRKPK